MDAACGGKRPRFRRFALALVESLGRQGRVQNPSREVQVLPDFARGEAERAHQPQAGPGALKVAGGIGIPRSWCTPW